MRTPSQTVGPFFLFGLCAEPQNELPGGSVRIEGQVFDGEERRPAQSRIRRSASPGRRSSVPSEESRYD